MRDLWCMPLNLVRNAGYIRMPESTRTTTVHLIKRTPAQLMPTRPSPVCVDAERATRTTTMMAWRVAAILAGTPRLASQLTKPDVLDPT